MLAGMVDGGWWNGRGASLLSRSHHSSTASTFITHHAQIHCNAMPIAPSPLPSLPPVYLLASPKLPLLRSSPLMPLTRLGWSADCCCIADLCCQPPLAADHVGHVSVPAASMPDTWYWYAAQRAHITRLAWLHAMGRRGQT